MDNGTAKTTTAPATARPKFSLRDKVVRNHKQCQVVACMLGDDGTGKSEYRYGLVAWTEKDGRPVLPEFPVHSLSWATDSELMGA